MKGKEREVFQDKENSSLMSRSLCLYRRAEATGFIYRDERVRGSILLLFFPFLKGRIMVPLWGLLIGSRSA